MRVTAKVLSALCERACRLTEDAYSATGGHIELDHADGSCRVAGRVGAGECAEAWRELARMVGRDGGKVEPGYGYSAMRLAMSALYECASAIEDWGKGRNPQVSVEETDWYIGAAREALGNIGNLRREG